MAFLHDLQLTYPVLTLMEVSYHLLLVTIIFISTESKEKEQDADTTDTHGGHVTGIYSESVTKLEIYFDVQYFFMHNMHNELSTFPKNCMHTQNTSDSYISVSQDI
jgi:hypothetical protein